MHIAVNTHATHLLPHHQQLPSHIQSPKNSLHNVQPMHLHHLHNLKTLLIVLHSLNLVVIVEVLGHFLHPVSSFLYKLSIFAL